MVTPAIVKVFISACTRDLLSFRRVLAATLLRLGFHPVVQEDFTLTYLPLREKLSRLIDGCDFVIHLAGKAYGAEPWQQPDGVRRSYTQHEYYYARERKVPVYAFLCAENFPYDKPDSKLYPEPEPPECLALQDAHRAFIAGTPENEEYALVKDISEGVQKLAEAQPRLRALCEHLEDFLPAVQQMAAKTHAAVLELQEEVREIRGDVKKLLEAQGNAAAPAVLWNMPPRAERFFGREEEFVTVLALWDEHRRLAITGSGGMGKTGLAAEVLAWFGPPEGDSGSFPRRLFRHDYYVSPSHDAALSGLLIQAGRDPQGLGREQMTAHVSAALGQPGAFLYLEGCEKAMEVSRLLEMAGQCRILLTTRQDVAPAGTFGWKLPPLRREDAGGLIAHLAQRGGAAVAELVPFQELANFLGGHALACSQAGRLLAQKCWPPKRLLAELEKSGLAALRGENREHGSVGYFLRHTLEVAEARCPGAAAAWHALALGSLAPAPLFILTAATGLDEVQLDAVLEELQNQGIARVQSMPSEEPGEFEPGWFLGHALIRTFGLRELPAVLAAKEPASRPEAVYSRWRDAWFAFLDRCRGAECVPGGHRRYDSLAPHFEALVEAVAGREAPNAEAQHLVLTKVAGTHRDHGRHTIAETLCRRDLEWCEAHRGPQDPATLTSANNHAVLLAAMGDLAGAEGLFRRTLAASETARGPEHTETLHCLNNLATLLVARGDFDGAAPLFRRILEVRGRLAGPDDPETLRAAGNLATALASRGALAEAEPLFNRVLEASTRLAGPEHPETLSAMNNLAALLHQKGDLEGAEKLFRRAFEGRGQSLGPDHPDTLASMNNLAALLSQRNDPQAEVLYRKALESLERTLGTDHAETLSAANNLAVLLAGNGDFAGAELLFRRTLEAQERALGPQHPDAISSLNNLGALRQSLGDWKGAEAHYERAVAAAEKVLPPDHPDRALYRRNLERKFPLPPNPRGA